MWKFSKYQYISYTCDTSNEFFEPADDIEPWMIWGYYISPMMYGQNAIAINEFLDKRWSTVSSSDSS